ncbi:c-type cytochrome [Sulfurimonas xiamenensis]|uniref:C-type cytochrome n=1 Tax=Sulfurimonas xiamenensis TaxID=2590021 RepID=A0AAJ4A2B5_9BACT|nr:c-type cytochrome [Sulfurimonas xiamenensis]QFR42470.1 c-type cytochrome [Sulfurimonas xiamenensis]
MKVKNIVLYTLLTTSTLFSQSGEELFNKYCAECHTTILGVDESGGKIKNIYGAPYAKDVIHKLKTETKTKEEFISFIKDYINEPDKRKSVYGKKAIKQFGLMPSLKGAMTDSESSILAEYLYSDYGKEPQKTEEKVVSYEKDEKSAQLEKANEELFNKYCAECHITVLGVDESGGKITNIHGAPYAKDVIHKLKTETKTKEEFVDFIKDYINEPDRRKSIYGKKAIKQFGLMPSLKGAMTDSESSGLAEYLYHKYD